MRRICLLMYACLFFAMEANAQVGINTDGSAPDPNAMLDVRSTNRGILVPRLTTVQRTAIPSPPEGLLLYDTNTKSFWYVKNGSWTEISGDGSGTVWLKSGNPSTNPATDFLGTTDNKPLMFRTGNVASGSLDPNGTTFFGYQAGMSNTGTTNSGFGSGALKANISGWNNTAVGKGSLRINEEGCCNTAIGYMALSENAYGSNNTFIGNGADVFSDNYSHSTALGNQALIGGNHSTALGSGTWVEGFNSTAIGSGAQVIGDNTIRLGNENVTGLYCLGPYYDTTGTLPPNLVVAPDGRIRRSMVSFLSGSGQANKIAIWNSSSQVGFDYALHWDNTMNYLGIDWPSPHAPLQLSNILGNRKIVMYELANNDHQFCGFGVNGNTMRYQVNTTADRHVFYAGTGSSSSTELMRIQGNGTVAIGTASPAESAVLELNSLTKGFLPPRMANTEMNAIPNPVAGMMIYNTVLKSPFFYDGTSWIMLSNRDGLTCGDVLYGGKTYHSVIIGAQCWMVENLDIGTPILGSLDQTNNGIIEKYCYENDLANCAIYGGLYQWAEMVQYLNGATNTTPWNPVPTGHVQGICQAGWHVPSDLEWTLLTTYLGGAGVAGGPMKETGSTHWAYPNTGATNTSGFTALAGGGRYSYGNFYYLTYYAYFWSSTEYSSTNAWRRNLSYDYEGVYRDNSSNTNGFSCRCLRD